MFQEAATGGDAYSQESLAWCYWKGMGVEKDEAIAFEMIEKAAKKGDMYALNSLAWFYYTGKVPGEKRVNDPRKPSYRKKDYEKAFELTLQSAEKGNPDAQYNVALFYLKGEGTEKDLEKAKIWMAKADRQGIPEAKQALQLITLNRGLEMIADNWFSLGEDSKKESPTNPQ